MMHKNKLVVCVKTNGKVLREDKETVLLPFGSEYSLLLKNLNSVRALLTVEIDGVNVLDGEKLVVNANSEIDLERFMKKGNQNQGNRFKFIERTSAIENGPRGIGAVDGIVRVSFLYEKRKTIDATDLLKHVVHHHHYDYWGPRYFARYPLIGGSDMVYGHASTTGVASLAQADVDAKWFAQGDGQLISKEAVASAGQNTMRSFSAQATTAQSSVRSVVSEQATLSNSAMLMNVASAVPQNDVGITVAGSLSDQKFHTVEDFEVEAETEVIVLNLKGKIESTKVEKPVTVQTKLKCSTCGTVNKSNAKFCRECGTALQIV